MSESVKYILEASSRKYNRTIRLDILQKNYSGTAEYKNISSGRIHLIKKNGGKINGTSVKVSMQSDENFEFSDFFQYDNSKHPAKLYIDDVCKWSGFLNSENYSEPYRNPPYSVQLVLTDGLARLKNQTWGDLGYSGTLSRMEILKTCLNTIGLGIGLSISVDLYENNMDTSRAMFAQVYNHAFIFNDLTLYEVIEKLLPLGATITQSNNRWLIRRNREDAQKTHLLYNQIGEYEGTETGESVLNLGTVGADVWPHGMPQLDMVHAWRNALIEYSYGKKQSFLLNYDFSMPFYSEETKRLINPRRNSILPSYKFTIPYWSNPNNIDIKVMSISGQSCVKLLSYVAPGSEKYITQTVSSVLNTVNSGGNFVFSLKYCVTGGYYSSVLASFVAIEVTVKIRVKLAGAGQTYYLTTSGWTTSDSKIEVTAQTTGGEITWTDLKVITNNIPVSGDLTIDLYQIAYTSGSGRTRSGNIDGVHFTDIRAYTSELETYPDPEEVDLPILDNAFTADTVVEIMPVDLPNVVNAEHYYQNGNYIYSGGEYQLADLWSDSGGDNVSLKTVIQNQLISYHGQPLQTLSCDWRGENLHLNAIVTHTLNNNRKFFVESGSHNLLNDVFSLTFEEIPPSIAASGVEEDEETPWILDDGEWGDVGEIWKDGETSVWEDIPTDYLLYEFTGHGTYHIIAVYPGDKILSLPQVGPGSFNGLLDGGVAIGSVPHTVSDVITYKTYEGATESYQVEFTAILGVLNINKRIVIKINL